MLKMNHQCDVCRRKFMHEVTKPCICPDCQDSQESLRAQLKGAQNACKVYSYTLTQERLKVSGVPLRHYLAGQLAPEIARQFHEDGTMRQFAEWRDGIAVEAYRMADLMIERSKEQ